MKNNQMIVSGWQTNLVNNETGSEYGIYIIQDGLELVFKKNFLVEN